MASKFQGKFLGKVYSATQLALGSNWLSPGANQALKSPLHPFQTAQPFGKRWSRVGKTGITFLRNQKGEGGVSPLCLKSRGDASFPTRSGWRSPAGESLLHAFL